MRLSNSEPSNERPALSHGLTQTKPLGVDDPTIGLFDKVESLKEKATNILATTAWPGKSAAIAQEFLKSIRDTPNLRNIPKRAVSSSPDIRNDAQQVVNALEDVRGRLESASLKYGAGEKGVSGSIKDTISWGASRSSNILRSCQEDLEKTWTALHNRLGDDSGATGAAPQQNLVRAQGTPGLSTSSPSTHEETRSVSTQALNAAGKIFTAVDTVTGLIPVVGSYVGAAAKVGSAVVDMVQKMDGNEQIAKDLEKQILKLSELIEYFKEQSARTGGENVKARIDGLKSEITDIQKQVEEWKFTGKLKKAWSATEDSDALNASVKTVEDSLAEMQVLASLNITDLLEQLYNHNLLNRLGDGDYGTQSKSSDNATCLMGTRVDILDRIDAWVKNESAVERVLWIRGMAGRGKSTIARTVASRWKDRATCATFHVRRGRDATNQQVVCAIARQLALSPLTEVASAILASVRVNENVAHQELEDQFQKLFVKPLQSLKYPSHPIILVVDALDEFQDTQYAVDFIDRIHDHASELPANIKFVITSRPETTLLNAFREDWQTVDLDTISETDINADIKVFIEDEFSTIRQKRGKRYQLGDTWPSSEEIVEVVKMSQGLFQWARTAMAYIGERSPDLRLRELLRSPSIGGRLDDLYRTILSKAFDPNNVQLERRKLLSWVLGTLVVTPHPVTLDIVAYLYADHGAFSGMEQIHHVRLLREDLLGDLNSLIRIPENPSEPMRFLHTSIRDYLTDKERSPRTAYEVDVIQDNRRLLDVCLHLMGRDLKVNICDLSDLTKPTSEITDIVDLKVSQGLRHCCRAWSDHLTAGRSWKDANTTTTMDLPSDLKPFSEKNILNWLEIMSLIGATDEAMEIAKNVWQWLLECPDKISDSSLITLWDDTQRFIAGFHDPISYGVLQIYASALAHCPVKTKLWEHYGSLATVHVPKDLQTQGWSSSVWRKLIHSEVYSVAISPDGKTFASGCRDKTIRFGNSLTGSPLGEPLRGHSKKVWSVAFSPDGKTLASGSEDSTIRLWNVQTGLPLCEPLQSHSKKIWSIAFSPDRKTLASGSQDTTIRLWDAQTGSPLGEPLQCHDYVLSVAFSADGKTLASGSRSIRLWNALTGLPLGEPLEGHSDYVLCVAFSPDGNTLASGSRDRTIRLWNAQTGSPLGEPLQGHSKTITCVAFSPDRETLASGSEDRTVRLWNVQTRSPLGESLKGHRRAVASIAFSPDGKTLATGSPDSTIGLWNVQTGSPLGVPLESHSKKVCCVGLSLDGKTLASGSEDTTIRLWNVQTGEPLGVALKGHSGSVNSVAFSPDGETLASGSGDLTTRLWNVHTGSPLGKPLTGHSVPVNSVAFSPDGKTIASRSDGGIVRLWNVQTGSPSGEPLETHTYSLGSVAFSPDGEVIITFLDKNIHYTSLPGIELWHHDQWLTSGKKRLLWLPEKYWRGHFELAWVLRGTVAFASGGFISCFDASGALKLPVD